jgi:transcriptional regulator with XRE-family HTH domain
MKRSRQPSDDALLACMLKEARQRAAITQVDLAQRLRRSQAFISKCEQGDRRIHAVDLIDFCLALGVEPAVFVRWYQQRRRRARRGVQKR